MTTRTLPAGRVVLEATLLELVSVVSTVEKTEDAVVARVVELVKCGDAKLTGTFRDSPVEHLFI
jgi:hypothetical protein